MDIALVILHADPGRGGAERYTVDLAHALAERGHRVSLVASKSAGVSDAVKSVPLTPSAMTRVARYRRFLDLLDEHLQRIRYDVVHAMLPVRRCEVYHPHAGIAVSKVDQTGLRLVFNLRRKAMGDVEHELLARSNAPVVLSLSEYVKKEIRAHYRRLPDERLVTLFNAVRLDHFDPLRDHGRDATRRRQGVDTADVAALIVAQDFERKGVPQAVEATRRVNADRPTSQPRLKLVVVGAEQPPHVEGDVIYIGATSQVTGFYAAADFFVLPTRHDPCSLVVLEALAMGLPVISTVYNGACEIMQDRRHGFVLTDPSDVDALAGAMRQLLDPARRAEMSRACLELRPRLSYEHHLDQLLNVYARVRGDRLAEERS